MPPTLRRENKSINGPVKAPSRLRCKRHPCSPSQSPGKLPLPLVMVSNAVDHQGERSDAGSPDDGFRILQGIARAARSYFETLERVHG